MTEIAIRVSGLGKTFKGKNGSVTHALSDVNFELYKGETLGIVGESGSGKSTMAKILAGLLPPTGGTAEIGDADITRAKGREKRDIYARLQMVFQDPSGSFDPGKTLGSGIGESLRNRRVPKGEVRRKVTELLNCCGLTEEFADRYPHEVSGGECQRAAIARALAIEPEILILDEATSALDVTVQAQVIRLLKKIRSERGLSIIFICHNIALVQQFCDRVLVLKDGRVVECGIPDEVIMNPGDPYTKTLIDSVL